MIRTSWNALAALVALGVTGAGAQVSERALSGEVTYLARIALPEDALLLIEARDTAGALVAAQQVETGGRQVPLPFAIKLPGGADLRLRAAILDGLRTTWIGPVVGIASESAGAMEAPMRLSQVAPAGFPVRLRCGGQEVGIEADADGARLWIGRAAYDLVPVPTASGARYNAPGDAETYFWSKGRSAMISLQGSALPECGPAITPPPFPMTARGQEPGWILTITEGQIAHSGPYGADPVSAPLPAPEPIPGGAAYDLPDVGLAARITARLCHDLATGMPYPYSAEVTRGQGADAITYDGCGGDPMDLLAGHWTVTEAVGSTPADPKAPDLTITEDGAVFGSGGCNRFSGRLTLTGEGLSIGPLATTMMACPEPVMAAEQAFFGALARVDRFDIAADGILRLLAADAEVLRAR